MFDQIAKIIAEQFGMEPEDITLDSTFEQDLGADSIDIVELSMALEDEFAIGEMDENDISSITTVGDLVQYIQAHVEDI